MPEDYRKYLENLDKILTTMKSNQNYESVGKLLADNNLPFNDRDIHFQIAEKLESEGFAKVSRNSVSVDVQITARGIDFISSGGYIGVIEKNEQKEKRETELIETTIKSNKTNVKLLKWNVGFAVLNVVLFIINLLIAYIALSKG